MYKEKDEAGFRGFGAEFQTRTSVEMYRQFLYQMKNALSPYIDHPVFVQSESEHFDKLRKLIKERLGINGGSGSLPGQNNQIGVRHQFDLTDGSRAATMDF